MNDKLTTDGEPTGPEAPTPTPDTDGRIDGNGRPASHGQVSRSQSRRREDEGLLITRWGYTWRAVTLRIADALAERIATPPPQTPTAGRHSRGRWALGGAVAAAAAYARSRGWL
jgi:hypothetical protein